MNTTQLLERFHDLVGDDSTFSTTTETAMLNDEYQLLCADRPWEFLKKSATGTFTVGVPSVTLPTDFASLTENAQYTSKAEGYGDMGNKVIFIISGSIYTPYPVVNWSDRRQYVNQQVYYIDVASGKLFCARSPIAADVYEFDYIHVPTDLVASTSPIFPARFHEILAYKMAIRSDVTERMEKARSNATENSLFAQQKMDSMALWNANLRND